MTAARTGFVPSVHGFRFANCWPTGKPVLTVPTPLGSVRLGDASLGVCGGMVFAALDHFHHARPVPADPTDPVFRYLVRRLFASWNLPAGGLRYYRWQARPGALARTLTGWPAVRAELDAGRPVPLGVVKVRSADPRMIGRNHQVLATGYEAAGHRLRVWVYDPNYPGDDALSLDLDADAADADGPVWHGREGATVRGFFRTRYTAPAGLPVLG